MATTDVETKRSKPVQPMLAGGLAVMAGLMRLVPHPPNLVPVGALGLFAGARMPWWQALSVPLLVMALSDVALRLLHGYPGFSLFVYGSMLVNVLIGRLLCRTNSPWRIGGASLLCSCQFFLVTNFGVWLGGTMYPQTWAGLLACYVAGLPFFGNTLLGDLGYSAVLFGLYAWMSQRAPATEGVRR